MRKTIVLASRPIGKPTPSNFKYIDEQVSELKPGEVLLKTKYISVDPYLRGRMNDAKSYVEPFALHKPI
jgi:NADPH-dependent curcumin reductase CurA